MPGCTDNQRRNLLFEGDLKLKEGSTKVKKLLHKKILNHIYIEHENQTFSKLIVSDY